jgi:hypothetical protein
MVILAVAAMLGGDIEAGAEPLPVAVLGDSDSHSYRDAVNGVRRGGPENARTFNWLEVWARLRPGEVDFGPLTVAGDRRSVARLKSAIGVPTRTPKKADYLYNYAWSGARCASLNGEWPEQARRLATRLRQDTARWDAGLVIIRIGVNDFGQAAHLRAWSADPDSARPVVDACVAEIAAAVRAIRGVSRAHIALVGIAYDYNTLSIADVADRDVLAVKGALSRFDEGLSALAEADSRVAFIDDYAWFQKRYGSRESGALASSAMVAGLSLQNAPGDSPTHMHTADKHAGTVASGLFLQHFILRLNEAFGWRLSVPADEEIVNLVR